MGSAKLILFITGVLLTFFMLLTSAQFKNKYKSYLLPLNKEEYSVKPFLPFGLLVMDLVRYEYKGRYDKKLLRKIGFIYGLDYIQYYMQIHMATKVVYMTVITCLVCFIGIMGDFGPEYLLSLLIAPILVFFLSDRVLDEKGEKRLQYMRRDFPDFVGKVTLLMGAGLNVRQTFEKIGEDAIKDSPLYIEVKRTVSELQSGKSEIECYQTFAERIKIKEGNRFTGIVIQNIRIGGAAMLRELDRLSEECWTIRKTNANLMAEQAQTKLTFPMILMFIAVLLSVMAPAYFSMKGL